MRPLTVSQRETCLRTEFIWEPVKRSWENTALDSNADDLTVATSELPQANPVGWVLLGAQFSHPEDCGMRSLSRTQCSSCGCGDPAWKTQMQIQVNQVDGSVLTSCAKGSQQLLKVLLHTQNVLLADDSKHNCSPRQVKECVCSDNMISLDFPGFLYCWACRAQTIPRYSQLSHLMPCSYPEMAFGFLNELSGTECP